MSSMGSDALLRPEDEDSPEFKEYLKQLLKMQANRAKGGHAAPSSGSSDAYIAKLNRLKLEKLARFKAGLPDIPLDTSYKPEDYASAIFEAAEVPVSTGAPLTLDAATGGGGGGGKVRSLTADEIRIAKLTEEKVRKELEESRKNNNNIKETSTVAVKKNLEDMQFKPRPVKFESDFENELISNMLGSPTVASSNPIPTPQKQNVVEISKPQHAETIAAVTPSKAVSTPLTRNLNMNSISSSNTVTSPPPPSIANSKPVMKVQQPDKPVKVRKLNQKELDIAGKALQMTVMHRGGGPFGAGRLKGEEAMQLSDALNVAYEMLKTDASQAALLEIKPKNKASSEEEVELPVLSSTKSISSMNNNVMIKTVPLEPLPTVVKKAKTEVITTQSVVTATTKPLATAKQSTATTASAQPIALGLDRFLQNSQNMNYEELDALRDGLIQCLTLIQSAINSNRHSAVSDHTSSYPLEAGTAVTDRMVFVDTYFNPEVTNTSGTSSSLEVDRNSNSQVVAAANERELKLALGLLLKHRGGPGFGHGRLEGNELILMEKKLRAATELLMAEAQTSSA